MRITMENCGNIEIGDLQLKPGVPNIKYACPGTGKSVLARALRAFIQDDIGEREALQPWEDTKKEEAEETWGPELFGYEELTSVACFDQRFVDRFDWRRSERPDVEYVLYSKQEPVRKDGKGPRRIHKPLPCNIRILAREAKEEINKALELLRYDIRLEVEEGDGEDSPLNGVVLVRLEHKPLTIGKKATADTDKENGKEALSAGQKQAEGETQGTQENGEEKKEEEKPPVLTRAELQRKQEEELKARIALMRSMPKPMIKVEHEEDGSVNRVLQLIIALMVFRKYAMKMEPSLILVDEPKLDYPKNVLFVMLSVMFFWEDGFKDRTSLYLTRHRYVVADCLHEMRAKFITEPYVTCMENEAGELTEKQILPEHIGCYDELAQIHVQDEVDLVYRLLFLRRCLGYHWRSTLARVMVTGLFAGMPVPGYHNRDMTIFRPMKKDEYATAQNEIRGLLPEFEYEKALASLKDKERLVELYFAARSAYEKLLIYQLLIPYDKRDAVVQDYIMNVFSEEEDEVLQVDPLIMNRIPYSITERCEGAIERLRIEDMIQK